MNEAILTRIESTDTHTMGILEFGSIKLFTMEPPWLNNEACISCIPVGVYPCILRQSPRYGWKYWLQNTEPRTYVLIHGGNLVKHTMGCILPGLRKGLINGQPAVLTSKAAVSRLQDYFENQPFKLEIKNG